MNLLNTAIEQNWTIGQFNQRIAEQSLLDDNNSLDRQLDRGEQLGVARRTNMPNSSQRCTNHPFIDATPLNLIKLQGGNQKCQH